MLRARCLAVVLCSVTWGLSTLVAQQSTDITTAADTAYRTKNWPEAEKLYEQLTQSDRGHAILLRARFFDQKLKESSDKH
jgi:O-methyltransferase involved in polyketide biosynthesis